jgi:hypothetical protein
MILEVMQINADERSSSIAVSPQVTFQHSVNYLC